MSLMFKAFLLCVFPILFAPPAAAKRVALVIGNSDYKETTTLPNPRNDAADMAGVLKRLEFEVLEGIDLDKRAMERLIRQFDQAIAEAEIAVFFYAGHAMQIAGQNLLLPIDARLSTEGDVDFETLPLSLVLQRMERGAKTSLVFLDACRNNALAQNLARSVRTRGGAVQEGLSEVRTSGIGSMLIGFSTQPGNVALDGDSRNSPYTAALLKEIEQPGRDVLSTLAVVRGAVIKATGGRQKPWEHTSLLGPVFLKAAPAPVAASVGGQQRDAVIGQTDVILLPLEMAHFRSAAEAPYPADDPKAGTAWADTPVTVSLAPVAFAHRTEPGRRARILDEKVSVHFGAQVVTYKPTYIVEISDRRCGDSWYCVTGRISPETLEPGRIISRTTMYFPEGKAPTWRTFVDGVLKYPNSPIKIVLRAQIEVSDGPSSVRRELTAECTYDPSNVREELNLQGFDRASTLTPVYLQGDCVQVGQKP